MFSRIAVINRGEPAVRLIRAVRELNAEFGYGIKVIALHTESERGALFVRLADEGVRIREKGDLGSPYLDHAVLRKALIESRADAAWVGWGFVAEDAGVRRVVRPELGVTFIGPPAEAMRRLGDKVEAKYLAEATNVPVAPWSGGPVETMEEALEHAKAIGYPMILKARSGGGGRGIRMVFDPSELEEAIERTQSEAQKAFNDHVIFMEHLVQGGRHIEVQVIADNYGNAWAPGVRDCSIQRRNQKLIEESFSPALTKEQADDLAARAIALVKEAGYRGAGTVEFLYQPEKKTFAFLEVNTRLQVEHPITEVSTGLDLVKLQILVADGYKLEGDVPPVFGHSIEARLNAEDADNGFAPSPGKVELLTLPIGPGHPGGHRHRHRRRDLPGLRLDGRQDHRLGSGPGRGDGPAAGGAARDHRGGQGRHDHQVVPAQAAGPARGDRRHRGHRLAGPGGPARGSRARRRRGRGPAVRRGGRVRVGGGAGTRRVPAVGPGWPAQGHSHGGPGGRAGLPRPDLQP